MNRCVVVLFGLLACGGPTPTIDAGAPTSDANVCTEPDGSAQYGSCVYGGGIIVPCLDSCGTPQWYYENGTLCNYGQPSQNLVCFGLFGVVQDKEGATIAQ